MKITNEMGLPTPVVRAVENPSYDAPEGAISATQLIQPARQYLLRQRHRIEIVEDVSDMMFALIGSNVHYILERAGGPGLIEHRVTVDLDGYKITGQADLCEDGALYDYKITSRFAVESVKPEHEAQLNIYRWLFSRINILVDDLAIIAILRDWSKRQAKRKKDYPQRQVVKLPVPVWNLGDAENYIRNRLHLISIAQELNDDELPECTPDERWATPEKWAVHKKGVKKAVRLLDTKDDAENLMGKLETQNPNIKYYIEHRPGENIRCEDYCNVAAWCSQFRAPETAQD